MLDHKNTLGMSSVNPHSKMIVVGSLNVDNYLYSTNLPHNGKTNFLSSYAKFPGGKGLNQAVGLTKLGHQATLIGCLGSDTDANYLYKELENTTLRQMVSHVFKILRLVKLIFMLRQAATP